RPLRAPDPGCPRHTGGMDGLQPRGHAQGPGVLRRDPQPELPAGPGRPALEGAAPDRAGLTLRRDRKAGVRPRGSDKNAWIHAKSSALPADDRIPYEAGSALV